VVERLRAILLRLRFGTYAVISDAMLEAENLKIALERYDGHPIPALLLAHQLMAIKQCLQRGKKGIPDVIDGLDLAIDSLYPYTDFQKKSYKLYLRRLEGTIKPKEEEKLRELGVRI
jgi:hypothetical protein